MLRSINTCMHACMACGKGRQAEKAVMHALQEKLDHFGIVALVVGTPVTALMAHEHGEVPLDVKLCFGLMLVAALCPPAARVAGFSGGTIAMVALHWRVIFNANLGLQLCLYGASALCFLRCKAAPVCACAYGWARLSRVWACALNMTGRRPAAGRAGCCIALSMVAGMWLACMQGKAVGAAEAAAGPLRPPPAALLCDGGLRAAPGVHQGCHAARRADGHDLDVSVGV